jgi:Ras-related protein Rab-1A
MGYYRGAHGFLLFFSLTSVETFEHVRSWLSDIEPFLTEGERKIMILVGNKADLIEERKVTVEDARKNADEFGIPYVETSAKNGSSVESVYHTISSMASRKLLFQPPKPPHLETPENSPIVAQSQGKGWFNSLIERIFK